MKKIKNKKDDSYNLNDIKAYMAMSAEDKLEWLQEAAEFLQKIMPAKSKRIWEKLKDKGF